MEFSYFLDPPYVKIQEFLQKAHRMKCVAFDIETNSLDPFSGDVLLIQFGVPGLALLFSKAVPKVLLDLLEDPKIQVLGHNLKFDYKWMKTKLNIVLNNCYDTMLVESSLFLGNRVRVGLGFVAERRLEIDMQKDVRTGFVGLEKGSNFSQAQLEYSARDVQVLFPIKDQQAQEVQQLGLQRIIDLENETLLVTGDMELEGFKLDEEKLETIIDETEVKLLEVCERIYSYHPNRKPVAFGFFADNLVRINTYSDALQLNSQPTTLQIFKDLGYPVEDTTHYTLVLLKPHCQFANDLLEYRSLKKHIDFPKDWLSKINDATGKLHPEYRQLSLWGTDQTGGTVSGRFSSKKPNPQQVPGENLLRSCFLAPEGYLTATIDYSAQEIRIMTNIAKDKKMVAFHLGEYGTDDYHGFAAHEIYGVPLEEVCKRYDEEGNEQDPPNKSLRYDAKQVNYSALYGIGPSSLRKKFPIVVPENHLKYSPSKWWEYVLDEQQRLYDKCGHILFSYRENFPELTRFLKMVGQKAVATRKVTDHTWGRVRHFPREMEEYRVRKAAANFVPQSNNASQMKWSLCNIRSKLPEVRTSATVHDEGVFQLPIGNEEELIKEISEIMIKCSDDVVTGPAKYGVGVSLAPHWTK